MSAFEKNQWKFQNKIMLFDWILHNSKGKELILFGCFYCCDTSCEQEWLEIISIAIIRMIDWKISKLLFINGFNH